MAVVLNNEMFDDFGRVIGGIHDPDKCLGKVCIIHNPTIHCMSNFPLLWRNDSKLFERICSHGIGHPDPDQLDYWKEMGMEWRGAHGCDGCCHDKESKS